MFPAPEVPVVQLSLDQRKPPALHYELGRQLQALRNAGVLILGSGNRDGKHRFEALATAVAATYGAFLGKPKKKKAIDSS